MKDTITIGKFILRLDPLYAQVPAYCGQYGPVDLIVRRVGTRWHGRAEYGEIVEMAGARTATEAGRKALAALQRSAEHAAQWWRRAAVAITFARVEP